MDALMIIVMVLNLSISLGTIVENLIKKKRYENRYEIISKNFVCNLEMLEDKVNSDKFETILRNSSYDTKIKMFNDKLYKRSKNRYMIYIVMHESYHFFSEVYRDKKIYCNIRINKDNFFHTIAHFRSPDTLSIKERLYYPDKNTDLINITTNNFNRFIISNIDDFKDSNIFMLQNCELNNRSKAIISISLKNEFDLIGCYTIYFSKPLDDKIRLSSLELALNTLKEKMSKLVEEYIELNNDNEDISNNMLIENKVTE